MLRGKGCAWRRCRFCDYHLDYSVDEAANFQLNRRQLEKVTGVYQKLEVINSGSFVDLDADTMELVKSICKEKRICTVNFECHWIHRETTEPFRREFKKCGINVKIKIGVETFDPFFRESYLDKGIDQQDPAEIARYFDECCLLQGLPGQTTASMIQDIETGLQCFERVCVNIMQNNSTPIKADCGVKDMFLRRVMPLYQSNNRVDILLENTDFGVGGTAENDQ